MKKFATNFGISVLSFSFSLLLGSLIAAISGISTALVEAEKNVDSTPMHSVELTQKGYIQVRNNSRKVYPNFVVFYLCICIKSMRCDLISNVMNYLAIKIV